MDSSYKITWIAHGWKEILCQQLILGSHASTAYLEERKKNNFQKEDNPITEKRKIDVLHEQGPDGDNDEDDEADDGDDDDDDGDQNGVDEPGKLCS